MEINSDEFGIREVMACHRTNAAGGNGQRTQDIPLTRRSFVSRTEVSIGNFKVVMRLPAKVGQ
jgi:hypothetical protein